MVANLDSLIRELRASGGDRSDVEIKSAAEGLPMSLTSSLSALANLPGGGIVVLGIDERAGCVPVPLRDRQVLKQGLGNRARSFVPPVHLTIEDATVDGMPVVLATVHECDPSAKPCRVASSGKAYLRSYDGDYEMSDLEEQAFLVARSAPHQDRATVPGTSVDDLDRQLTAVWMDTVRSDSAAALGRFRDDDELLRRAGIVAASGELSVAGLLTLGSYPQQFFPRYVLQVAADPLPGDPPGTRARNAATLDGPIPIMLEGAQRWAARNMSTTIRGEASGAVISTHEYPLEAVRELVTNALVHRDLSAWSEGMAVEVRLRTDRFVVTNPGGLYGITVDRLGGDHVTSARNARLISLCQYARSPDRGARVIEALATGLPKVVRELAAAGLPPARFLDQGIRFTVVLKAAVARRELEATPPSGEGPSEIVVTLPPHSRLMLVYSALEGDATVTEIQRRAGGTPAGVRRTLQTLRDRYQVIEQIGGQGRLTVYRRSPGIRVEAGPK